jgi:hypothetical protein
MLRKVIEPEDSGSLRIPRGGPPRRMESTRSVVARLRAPCQQSDAR